MRGQLTHSHRTTVPIVGQRLGHQARPSRLSPLVRLTVAVVLVAGLVAGCSGSKSGTSSQTDTTSPAASSSSTTATPPAASSTSSAKSADATGLSGKWKGNYSGADTGTFVLNWIQNSSKLTGTISLSGGGALPLTGTVQGNTITFGTVGNSTVTYNGHVSGDRMAGTYQLNGSPGGPWSATRA